MSELTAELDTSDCHRAHGPREGGHIIANLATADKVRSRPIMLFVVSGIALIAVIAMGAAITIFNLRDRALSGAETGLRNLALVLAEQTNRNFQAAELVQKTLTDCALRAMATGVSG